MIHYEAIEPARYLEDLERVQTEILSDAFRAYRAFCEIVAQDPELWKQRADDYASRLGSDEADMRLQQDFVDQLVLNRSRDRTRQVAQLNTLIEDDVNTYSGLLAQMSVLDDLNGSKASTAI